MNTDGVLIAVLMSPAATAIFGLLAARAWSSFKKTLADSKDVALRVEGKLDQVVKTIDSHQKEDLNAFHAIEVTQARHDGQIEVLTRMAAAKAGKEQ